MESSSRQIQSSVSTCLISARVIRESRYSLRHELGNLEELVDSINKHGLLSPIIVRIHGDSYEVVAGNRRLAACRSVGMSEIPCFIVNANDREAYEIALIENMQRKSLDPIEEAVAFRRYVVECGWGGVTSLSKRIGKSEVYVSHRLLLLDLPQNVKEKISTRILNPSCAKELVWIQDAESQKQLAEEAIRHGLSVRQLNRIVKLVKNGEEIQHAVNTICEGAEAEKYSTDSQNSLANALEQGILSLRYALGRMDSILETVESSYPTEMGMRQSFQKKRYVLHQLIDYLLKEKRRVSKAYLY
ncbi:MAG: ParB/RepB/Spo0J family partition protein [Thaumarchaeota archaeon]|nr:ParB/RepB/Spo0J family partition protein [Nitrososphaerota archaeon]